MVTIRVLVAMAVGAVVAALGAVFLGEYEFDEALPIAAGALLGLVVAEIVVSLGHHRSWTMAGILAVLVGVSIVLAGHLDAGDVEPVKAGAYLSAALGAGAAALRTAPWGRRTRDRVAQPGT
ncbi:hypothetical protein NHL50_03330 [Acidimicrobiia bacterium EGI L10123]|uniref:hypothetical protein n=1 Tax=Salinilacustrithrix flava TaxID=2957203 RepID=UPI003D7C2A05|nr:hypothetical protein [Acidimicrobiia bacterium EGI L10123]